MLGRAWGDRGTRRARQSASDAMRGISCAVVPSGARGASKGPGPTPVHAGTHAEGRLAAQRKDARTLKDLKNDSSSVVFPKPASPTTIRLNDSRGGSRESRGSMLRLWYGSRGGDPIELTRDLASRSRRYSSPMTPVQWTVGDHRAQGRGRQVRAYRRPLTRPGRRSSLRPGACHRRGREASPSPRCSHSLPSRRLCDS